ncbi:MAG: 3-oxoacyl-ACP synthase III family protein [Acidimicrobiia bacterium]
MGIPLAVLGRGVSLPEARLTNADLEARFDTSDEWIRERTGIIERRIAGPDESTATLAIGAADKALANAGLAPSDISLCIVATVTPEQPVPATAAFVQESLGLRCGAFDLGAACAGFVYSLVTGATMMDAGRLGPVLIIGAETTSRWVRPDDRNTAVLFGDGAAATVIAPSDSGEILAFDLGCDGSAIPFLEIRAGGSRLPTTHETVDAGEHWLHMDGREVFKRAVRAVSDSIRTTLEQADVAPEEVSLFVPHQANARIIDALLPRVGLDPERTVVNVDRFGNTSAASVPIALCEALDQGRVNDGDLVLLTGFGAGMAWATTLVRWSSS